MEIFITWGNNHLKLSISQFKELVFDYYILEKLQMIKDGPFTHICTNVDSQLLF